LRIEHKASQYFRVVIGGGGGGQCRVIAQPQVTTKP
jgi:hypothetical protein